MTTRNLIFMACVAALVLSAFAGASMFKAELSKIEERRARRESAVAANCQEAVKESNHLLERAKSESGAGDHCKAEELLTAALAHIESAAEVCAGVSRELFQEGSVIGTRNLRDAARSRCRDTN